MKFERLVNASAHPSCSGEIFLLSFSERAGQKCNQTLVCQRYSQPGLLRTISTAQCVAPLLCFVVAVCDEQVASCAISTPHNWSACGVFNFRRKASFGLCSKLGYLSNRCSPSVRSPPPQKKTGVAKQLWYHLLKYEALLSIWLFPIKLQRLARQQETQPAPDMMMPGTQMLQS